MRRATSRSSSPGSTCGETSARSWCSVAWWFAAYRDSGKQIGVIAASAIAISPDAFISRVRAAGGLKSPDALGGRFDDPPALENLARLSLDAGDLDRLRRCRPGDCRLNLSDHEISAVRQALATILGGGASQANQVFREVVLDRARRYQSGGLKSLPDYHDRREPVRPAVIFSEILQQTPYLKSDVPGIAAYLEQFPFGDTAGSESSLQWSRVMMNDKAVVMVTHLSIFRPQPGPRVPTVLVAGKQVYASRYMNGELTLTMLFAGTGGSPGYLVHVHRSQLDELEGTFSGLKRSAHRGPDQGRSGAGPRRATGQPGARTVRNLEALQKAA